MALEADQTPPRRQRDRRAQLTEAAAELFRRRGYHGVSVNDIAAAAGLTGPAVYRHFNGKQDVLAQVLLAGIDRFAEVTEEALGPDGATRPEAALSALTSAMATLAVDRREVTALWRWQGRHLDRGERDLIRGRGVDIMNRWITALRAARTELSEPDAGLLCWAALSVFGSVADHHVSVPRRRFEALLCRLADAVLAAGVIAPARPAPSTPERPGWQPQATPPSRREQLLSAATTLFRERGYQAVSMEDIGARAGIAGPSIYRHFTSKTEILLAASYRMADRLTIGAERAVDEATDAMSALTGVVKSYVDNVMRVDNLVVAQANEATEVPDRDRRALRRIQRSYVAGWVRLLREVSPGLTEPDARIVVHAALTIVNDLGRTTRIARRPDIVAELAGLATTVLVSATSAPSPDPRA